MEHSAATGIIGFHIRQVGIGVVRIELEATTGDVRLRVSDDGTGTPVTPGNGLAGMRERLAALEGSLEIESVRGTGTRLLARIPLPAAADDVPVRTVHEC